jgi:hypothetical protein
VPQPLLTTLSSTAGGRAVVVPVPVPKSAGSDSKVVIRDISVAVQPLTHGQSLPAQVTVMMGMPSTLRLEGAANACASTPVITRDYTLYEPRQESPDVLVFSTDGTPLLSLPVTSLGLSENIRVAAFEEATATLLLAEVNSVTSKLVAVDAVNRAVRWSTELGALVAAMASQCFLRKGSSLQAATRRASCNFIKLVMGPRAILLLLQQIILTISLLTLRHRLYISTWEAR